MTRVQVLGLALASLGLLLAGPARSADDANAKMMEALQAVQQLVGEWQGSGKSDATNG